MPKPKHHILVCTNARPPGHPKPSCGGQGSAQLLMTFNMGLMQRGIMPGEVLVTVMRHHQKYFSVETNDGKLAPHFIAVMNIPGDPDGLVRHGPRAVARAVTTSRRRMVWSVCPSEFSTS